MKMFCFTAGSGTRYPDIIILMGVFSRSYCCYGNLLCYEKDNNVFTDSSADFDTMIVASSDKEWLQDAIKI